MRGARIENGKRSSMQHRRFVAPHTGNENWNMVAVMRDELEVSHSPSRERELKFQSGHSHSPTWFVASHARSENWNILGRGDAKKRKSLPMRGAWIENTLDKYEIKAYQDRSPYGERELKSDNVNNTACGIWSLLTRGAWIENSI